MILSTLRVRQKYRAPVLSENAFIINQIGSGPVKSYFDLLNELWLEQFIIIN